MLKRAALLTTAALILPACAQARINVLATGSTQTGSTGYAPPNSPLEGGSFGYTRLPAHPRWFRATIAWDSQTGNVLVGCRGHGTARVTVRAAGRRGQMVCRDLGAWRVVVRGVPVSAHVRDSILITPQRSLR